VHALVGFAQVVANNPKHGDEIVLIGLLLGAYAYAYTYAWAYADVILTEDRLSMERRDMVNTAATRILPEGIIRDLMTNNC